MKPVMSQNKPARVHLIVLATVILFCLSGCSIQNLEPSVTPFASNRKIVSQTLPLKEKWRVQPGMISGGLRHTMQLTHGFLIEN